MDPLQKSGLGSSSSLSIALPPSVPHKPSIPLSDRNGGGGGVFDRAGGSSYSGSRNPDYKDAQRRRPSPSKDSQYPPFKRHDHKRSPSPDRRYDSSSRRESGTVWDHHHLDSEARPRYDDRDRRYAHDDRERYDRGSYRDRPRDDDRPPRPRWDERPASDAWAEYNASGPYHKSRPPAYDDDDNYYRPRYSDKRSPPPRGRSRSPRNSRESPRRHRSSPRRRDSSDRGDKHQYDSRQGDGPAPTSTAMTAANSADTEEGEIPDSPDEPPPSSPDKAIVDKYRPKRLIRPAYPSGPSVPLVSPSEAPAPPPEPSGVPPPPPDDAPPFPSTSPSGIRSSAPSGPRPSPYGPSPSILTSNGHPPDHPLPYGTANGNGPVNPYAPAAKPANRKVQDLQGHGEHATPHAPNRDLLNPSTRAATPSGERPVKVEVPPKLFTRRTADEELAALGKQFVGTNGLDAYDLGTKLGEGTFGVVTKGVERATGKQVALKKLITHNPRDGVSVTTVREIKIIKALHHENVVDIMDMIVERKNPNDRGKRGDVFMVFPYMDHDLCGLLNNSEWKMTHSIAKLIFRQTLEGLAYIHANNYIHRDIKTANILVDRRGQVKIADFGLARAWTDGKLLPPHSAKEYTNMVVTRWYRAPELLLGDRKYGPAIDMWSMGCVLGEMYLKNPILQGDSDRDQLRMICAKCGPLCQASYPDWDKLPGFPDAEGHPWEQTPQDISLLEASKNWHMERGCADLMMQLLTLDPSKRLTATQALDHRWFWTQAFPATPKDALISVASSHEMTSKQRRDGPAPAMPAQVTRPMAVRAAPQRPPPFIPGPQRFTGHPGQSGPSRPPMNGPNMGFPNQRDYPPPQHFQQPFPPPPMSQGYNTGGRPMQQQQPPWQSHPRSGGPFVPMGGPPPNMPQSQRQPGGGFVPPPPPFTLSDSRSGGGPVPTGPANASQKQGQPWNNPRPRPDVPSTGLNYG